MKTGPRSSETTLAAPVEATLDLAPGLQSAPSHERIVATRRPPRDYFLRRALAAADLAAVVLAGAIAMVLDPTAYASQAVVWFVVMLPVWLVLFRLYGLYERDVKRVSISVLDDLPALFHSFVIGTLLVWIVLKLGTGQGLTVAEAISFGLFGVVIAATLRVVARRTALHLGGPGRVLLVGQSPTTEALVRKLRAHSEYGLEPVGEVSLGDRPGAGSDLPHLGRLGELDLRALVVDYDVERVIVNARDLSDDAMMSLIHDCGAASVKVSIVPDHINALGPSVSIDEIEGLTILGLNPLVLSSSSRFLKRSLDIVGATLGLVIAGPILALLAIAIKLDSPGPVLFRQRRIGRGGEPFTLVKFRSMVVDAEARTEELRSLSDDPDWLKLDRDPRITRVGRLLRATQPRRVSAALERPDRRDEPGRSTPPDRLRGRPDRGLDALEARPRPRRHRPLAGPRAHRHPVPRHGQPRLHLRDQLVAVARREADRAHGARRAQPARR